MLTRCRARSGRKRPQIASIWPVMPHFATAPGKNPPPRRSPAAPDSASRPGAMDGAAQARSDPFAPTPHAAHAQACRLSSTLVLAALALASCRPYSGSSSPSTAPCPSNPKLLAELAGHRGPAGRVGTGAAAPRGPGGHRGATTSTRSTRPAEATALHGALPALDELLRGGGRPGAHPAAARAAGGGDGHMAVIQPDGWEYDFWQVRDRPAGGGTLVVSHGGRTRATATASARTPPRPSSASRPGVIGGDRDEAGQDRPRAVRPRALHLRAQRVPGRAGHHRCRSAPSGPPTRTRHRSARASGST